MVSPLFMRSMVMKNYKLIFILITFLSISFASYSQEDAGPSAKERAQMLKERKEQETKIIQRSFVVCANKEKIEYKKLLNQKDFTASEISKLCSEKGGVLHYGLDN